MTPNDELESLKALNALFNVKIKPMWRANFKKKNYKRERMTERDCGRERVTGKSREEEECKVNPV